MNTVVDRAPGNETLPPPKEISVTRFGRHERLFQTLQQARIFRPSIASRNTPPSPSPLVDLSTHGRIYATILRARNVRGLCLAICLFDYPTEILSHCVSSIFAQIFRSLSRSRFFRHTFSLLPRYLIFIGGIFQRYFFSAPGNTALLYIRVYVYYIRATLKNIKLSV